jgi:Acyl-CoA reductase (LuxC)
VRRARDVTRTNASMQAVDVPFVIRGRIVEGSSLEYRSGNVVFRTPDPHTLLSELPLASRVGMADLHSISIDDIVDFLAALGDRLRLAHNEHLQDAFAVTVNASNLTEAVVRATYDEQLARFFQPERIHEAIEHRLGRAYLEGWVDEPQVDGRNLRVRAFGARTTHVVAGNSPGVSAQTIVRNAITRSDAIIKTPANDPVTAVAILRTMVDLDPEHPLTRHVSALHWRGGDELVEQVAFTSPTIDKLVAWGGVAAIKHVAKYVGPGVELIALDPKISISLLGREIVTDAAIRTEAARRLAIDVGMMNQEACVNSRIAYVEVGGLENPEPGLRDFAAQVFAELQNLPAAQSTPVDRLPPELRDEVDAALLIGEPEVVGGGTGAGGVLISWDGRPVDYSAFLAARYVNLVPVARMDDVLERVSSTTQTCGAFPVALRETLRDRLALAGVQRVTTLGTAAGGGDNQAIPQDGIEVLRRMCRWIVDEADRTRG